MKKILLISLIAIALLQSCTPRVIELKSNYQAGPVKSKIEQPFEKVWEKVIDFIAETGVSVKMIDKASGLVIADAASFMGTISQEDEKGRIVNPKAWIVSERLSTDFPSHVTKYDAVAQWNMRVKQISATETVISVNLHSIKIDRSILPLTGKSTGNFEKYILDGVIN